MFWKIQMWFWFFSLDFNNKNECVSTMTTWTYIFSSILSLIEILLEELIKRRNVVDCTGKVHFALKLGVMHWDALWCIEMHSDALPAPAKTYLATCPAAGRLQGINKTKFWLQGINKGPNSGPTFVLGLLKIRVDFTICWNSIGSTFSIILQ